jgi:RNA polymerase sigma factor (sigma-70 family)
MKTMNEVHKSPGHYSDAEIIARILNGETQLYEIIVRRYNSFLYKIGRSYSCTHHDTEDLMQETYVNAFFNLSKFGHRSSFKTWLARIMLNQCYRKKQKASTRNETPQEILHPENSSFMSSNSPGTEKTILNKELGRVLEQALGAIPADYRMVFTLRELNGLSVAETAEAVDISESNVKVRLNRAKVMLRGAIGEMYSPDDIFEFNLVYCDRMVEQVMTRIHNTIAHGENGK